MRPNKPTIRIADLSGLMLLLAGCLSSPQSDPTGTPSEPPATGVPGGAIEGTVLDDRLLAIPNAQIVLQGRSDPYLTDGGGSFRILDVAPGHHSLEVSKDGYKEKTVQTSVDSAETTTITVQLERQTD